MKGQLKIRDVMKILKEANQDKQLLEKQVRTASQRWHVRPEGELNLRIVWNLDPNTFHKSLDGVGPEKFKQDYEAVVIGTIDIVEVEQCLHADHKRHVDSWHHNHVNKTACLYEWIYRGYSVTPPFIQWHGNAIVFLGGNHRFYLAMENAEQNIPFIIKQDELKLFQARCSTFEMLNIGE